MPLVAELDGARIDATKHDPKTWEELKQSEGRKRLVMPLCGIRAVAKSRGADTRFFAHYSVADCNVEHGGETAQHLALKESLATCIDSVPGWHAVIEFPHPSRAWIIDVLAESDDKQRRVAFEVQLSSQSPETYFHRTDRYFSAGIFPVWLVPRRLEFHPIEVPTVVTGFGKTSMIPDDVSDLMTMKPSQGFVNVGHEDPTLGDLVEALLLTGHGWALGSPAHQAEVRQREESRREAERQKAAAKKADFEKSVQEMNLRCVAPELDYGRHFLESGSETFIWATLMGCRKCEKRMLVWDARSPGRGKKWLRVPDVRVKDKVGPKRYENSPEVHGIIDRWIHAAGSEIRKAHILKGAGSSAFVCPECKALMGQAYIARIRPELWSLIAGPEIHPEDSDPVQPVNASWERTKGHAAIVPSTPQGAGLCDLCGTNPHPEHTCLWRRYRALTRAAAGGHHFSDDLHDRIESGELDAADGTALLRRMLERAAAHKDAHGRTGSVQELEDDVAAGRPLTRYR